MSSLDHVSGSNVSHPSSSRLQVKEGQYKEPDVPSEHPFPKEGPDPDNHLHILVQKLNEGAYDIQTLASADQVASRIVLESKHDDGRATDVSRVSAMPLEISSESALRLCQAVKDIELKEPLNRWLDLIRLACDQHTEAPNCLQGFNSASVDCVAKYVRRRSKSDPQDR